MSSHIAEQLYRDICRLDEEKIKALKLSQLLELILSESLDLRRLRKEQLRYEHRSLNRSKKPGEEATQCLQCKNLPPSDRCVRVLEVTFDDMYEDLRGSVIVPHELDDNDSALPKVNKLYCTALL